MFDSSRESMDNPTKFYGNYRGRVVNDNDPEGVGRVQIRVYSVFDGVDDSALPWAIYSDPFMGGQSDLGGYFVPDVGSDVWVFFEEGDFELPVYFAGAPARPHFPNEKNKGPRNKVFKTKSGFVFEIEDTEGETRLSVREPNGNSRVSDSSGNKTEKVTGDLVIDVDRSVLVSCPKIDLGELGDLEQSVLGNALETWINGHLIPWLNQHTHPSAPNGPSTPPSTPFVPGTASPGGDVWSKKNRNQ